MTHILANTFASLYTKGFGVSTEEQLDENINETAKDASGTGMGEGEGCKDVSDQITDEDQLLGSIKVIQKRLLGSFGFGNLNTTCILSCSLTIRKIVFTKMEEYLISITLSIVIGLPS